MIAADVFSNRKMVQQFRQDLLAGALIHGFLHHIAVALGIEPVAPPDRQCLAAGSRTSGCVEDRQRDHPVRVLQGQKPAASRAAVGEVGDLIEDFLAGRRDRECHPARVGDPVGRRRTHPDCRSPCASRPTVFHNAHDRPGCGGGGGAAFIDSGRHVGGLRAGRHEHDIVGSDVDRGRGASTFVVEPVDGQAAGRPIEANVLHDGALDEVHAAAA